MRTIIVLSSLLISLLVSGCEYQEGTVKYDDCRKIVYLKSASWRLKVYSFTCEYVKRKSGKIVTGRCIHVETTDDGKCETAYIYDIEVKPDAGCSQEYPFFGNDGKCYKYWYDADSSYPQDEKRNK